jgi:DNA-binding CsgD family transcriptional regulator
MPPELALLGRVLADTWSGHLDRAQTDAVLIEQAALRLGDRDAEWTSSLYRGRVSLARGELPVSLQHFERAGALARELGDPAGTRWTLGGRALCLSMLGRGDDCAAVGQEIADLPPSSGGLFDIDLLQRGRAWVHVCAGRFSTARDTLHEAARQASALGQPAVEVIVRHDLVRLGDDGQEAPLAALAEQCDGPWPTAAAAHASARRSGSGADLMHAANLLAACGARLDAAESATAAAQAHRRSGRPREATSALRAAAHWLEAAPGARTPALVATPDATPLTKREREIAVLAAQQMSAAAIAAELHLSRRTVENHLQRIYTKLGIGSRAELAAALDR